MSWIEELYKTYMNCYGKEDIISSDRNKPKKPLLPPFHTLQNSHIEIILDKDGNFLDAERISTEEIIMPCTEKSSSAKTGTNPPSHPLCEMIKYCAGDYSGTKNSYFNNYFKELSAWNNSDLKHPFVTSIYNYILKKRLVSDLINTGKEIFKKDEDPGDLMVRWKVEIPGENETRCWKNNSLFECWQKYCEIQDSVSNVCMVTGEFKPLALNHPKRIRHGGDGGKLISSNDKSGFTFRGRFLTDVITINGKKEEIVVQPVSVSVDVSQKAHSALSWLIDRQGFQNDTQVIVSWAVSGKETPNLSADTMSIFADSNEEKIEDITKNAFNDVGQNFARKLSKKIAGYRANLSATDKIVVMGLDSAGPGRISITYYRELTGSDFLERIESWHKEMAWHFRCYHDKKQKKIVWGHFELAPSPEAIAEACYGTKRDEDFKKYKRSICERLLPCIIDGRNVPIDLVLTAIKKASNRLAYGENEHWQWEQALSVACALYSCYSIRDIKNTNKTEKIMALENERTDRDYLYGRLLAVAEHLEEAALYAAKENRETTAARLMQRFADFPYPTWRNIESALVPYKSRLQANRPAVLYKMKTLLDEIHSKFQAGDYEKDGRLSGAYLLGYHCQRLDLSYKKIESEIEVQG